MSSDSQNRSEVAVNPAGEPDDDALLARLEQEPQHFEFFQAVRLIQNGIGDEPSRRGRSPWIGTDALPEQELLKLVSHASLSFPGHDVVSVKREGDSGRRVLRSSVMGLIGASGALPTHYSKLVSERVRRKDFALRDFLDIFNHRSLSFFYRAWEKYHLPAQYERSRLEGREDIVTQCLYALLGMGGTALSRTARTTSSLRDRLNFSDSILIGLCGFFVTPTRNAVSLERMLLELTGVPARIEQFRGQWVHLPAEDQSMLPGPACPEGRNHRLGESALAGAKIWSGESRFRIRLGPMRWREFQRFSPGGSLLKSVGELAALYVGPGLEFDVQPLLDANEIPPAKLGGESRLGWNTWMLSKPRMRHGDEAVFVPAGEVPPLYHRT
jgi:type VI secretion system protein ImpH